MGITDLICECVLRLEGRRGILVIEERKTIKSINNSKFTSFLTTGFFVIAVRRKKEAK